MWASPAALSSSPAAARQRAKPSPREIRDNGGQSAFVAADIDSEESVTALTAATVERFGRLDVAVGKAGISLACGRRADELSERVQLKEAHQGPSSRGWLIAQLRRRFCGGPVRG
ncbi:SDR family oxidoreductase [Kitasatospora sp. NPDC004531]